MATSREAALSTLNILSLKENFPEGFATVLSYKSRPRNQGQLHTPFQGATSSIQQLLTLWSGFPFLQAHGQWGTELRALCMPDKYFINWATSLAFILFNALSFIFDTLNKNHTQCSCKDLQIHIQGLCTLGWYLSFSLTVPQTRLWALTWSIRHFRWLMKYFYVSIPAVVSDNKHNSPRHFLQSDFHSWVPFVFDGSQYQNTIWTQATWPESWGSPVRSLQPQPSSPCEGFVLSMNRPLLLSWEEERGFEFPVYNR